MTEDRAINADDDGRRRTPPNAQPIIMAFIVCLHYNNHHQPSRQTVSFAPSPLPSIPHIGARGDHPLTVEPRQIGRPISELSEIRRRKSSPDRHAAAAQG